MSPAIEDPAATIIAQADQDLPEVPSVTFFDEDQSVPKYKVTWTPIGTGDANEG